MFIICGICEGPLDQPPPGTPEKVVTIRCGHIYHHFCINQWWKAQNPERSPEIGFGCRQCPHVNPRPLVFQVYFSSEDERAALQRQAEYETLQGIQKANEDKLKKLDEDLRRLKQQSADLPSSVVPK